MTWGRGDAAANGRCEGCRFGDFIELCFLHFLGAGALLSPNNACCFGHFLRAVKFIFLIDFVAPVFPIPRCKFFQFPGPRLFQFHDHRILHPVTRCSSKLAAPGPSNMATQVFAARDSRLAQTSLMLLGFCDFAVVIFSTCKLSFSDGFRHRGFFEGVIANVRGRFSRR